MKLIRKYILIETLMQKDYGISKLIRKTGSNYAVVKDSLNELIRLGLVTTYTAKGRVKLRYKWNWEGKRK